MSGFFDTPARPRARKVHRCIACFHPIQMGEQYTMQSGFYEGRPFRNKFHEECFEALAEEGEFEFIPGSEDPPDRAAAVAY